MSPSQQKGCQWQAHKRGEVGAQAVVVMSKHVAQDERDIMAGRRAEVQGVPRRLA